MNDLRFSASRLKLLNKCSYSFYLQEVLKIPSAQHPKTTIGLLVHSILECLFKERHRTKYYIIFNNRTVYGVPSVKRLINIWKDKYKLSQELIDDVDSMVLCGLEHTNFLEEGADEIFPPEYEFNIKEDKLVAKGFFDKMARYGNLMVVKDFKTFGTFQSEEEIMEELEVQGTTYQLAVYEKFGLECRVEFYLLRRPPTKKNPKQHIRIIEPKNKYQLSGFKSYAEDIFKYIKYFGWVEATEKFLYDNPAKRFFCYKVCPYSSTYKYYELQDKEGNFVASWMPDGKARVAKNGEKIVSKWSKKCLKFGGKLL